MTYLDLLHLTKQVEKRKTHGSTERIPTTTAIPALAGQDGGEGREWHLHGTEVEDGRFGIQPPHDGAAAMAAERGVRSHEDSWHPAGADA